MEARVKDRPSAWEDLAMTLRLAVPIVVGLAEAHT